MLREFDETIHEEMDYAAEGRNAERFRENFKDLDKCSRSDDLLGCDDLESSDDGIYPRHKGRRTRRTARQKISPEKVNRLLIKTYLKTASRRRIFPRRSASGKSARNA